MSVEIRSTRLDDPVAARLIDDLQADLTVRYGEPDPVQTHVQDFWPPRGIFLVAWLDGRPVGCVGLKEVDTGVAELKRLYVAPSARGAGVARALLAAVEEHARGAGARAIRLITGEAQPEAVALYASAGWRRGELFGAAIEFGWTQAIVFERDLEPLGAAREAGSRR
ncbi:MAG: GNAT family N-acetyltransferase [Actinomycetota bacterium]|nr:GNAT family N-acetyltransferase [Actinomycetota bacterium]